MLSYNTVTLQPQGNAMLTDNGRAKARDKFLLMYPTTEVQPKDSSICDRSGSTLALMLE